MMKRIIFALLVAFQFAAATSVATAEIEIPMCYPCPPPAVAK
jgi:hypothetical protein